MARKSISSRRECPNPCVISGPTGKPNIYFGDNSSSISRVNIVYESTSGHIGYIGPVYCLKPNIYRGH